MVRLRPAAEDFSPVSSGLYLPNGYCDRCEFKGMAAAATYVNLFRLAQV